jgi:2-polyprenyl-6-methoxyphenol hydroxylase-like FAD-dependent oxidoreductase
MQLDYNTLECITEPLKGQWHKGPVTLVGDAVHPTLPFMGQGANQAMEDSYFLSKFLSDETLTMEQAMQKYYLLREPKTTKLVQMATAKGKSLITTSPITATIRNLQLKVRDSNLIPGKIGVKIIDELIRDVAEN